MREHAHDQSTPRRRWQFTVRGLALFFVVFGLLLAGYRYFFDVQPLGPMRVHVTPSRVWLNGRGTSWEELPGALRKMALKMDRASRKLRDESDRLAYHRDPFCLVYIDASDDATFGDFRRAIEIVDQACKDWCDLPPRTRYQCVFAYGSGPDAASPDFSTAIAPYFLGDGKHDPHHLFHDYYRVLDVYVSADNQGELGEVNLHYVGQTKGVLTANDPRFTEVHSAAADYDGYFDPPPPPGLLGERCGVSASHATLWCDDQLRFRHVKSAIHALTRHDKSSGCIRLVDEIYLHPLDKASIAAFNAKKGAAGEPEVESFEDTKISREE